MVCSKRFFALAISTTILLTGCASDPLRFQDFGENLKTPRPFTTQESTAKKAIKKMAFFDEIALGCVADTAIWKDEIATERGGFNPKEIYDAARGIWRSKSKIQACVEKYGTVPEILKNQVSLNRDSEKTLTSTITDSIVYSGISSWSPGKLSLDGLAFSFAKDIFTVSPEQSLREAEKSRVNDLQRIVIGYKLSSAEKNKYLAGIPHVDNLNLYHTNEKLAMYKDIQLKVLKSLIPEVRDLGYAVNGDLKMPKNPAFGLINQELTSPTGEKALLQVMYQTNPTGMTNATINDDFSVISFSRIMLLPTPNLKAYEKNVVATEKLLRQAVKHNDKIFAYLPAREINGQKYPQSIINKSGEHFFVVPVKRQ